MNLVEVFVHKSTMEIITDGIIDEALLGLIQCSLIMKHRFFCPTIKNRIIEKSNKYSRLMEP